jgi:DNA-binding transcriptional LysR family regulator
MPTRAAKMQIRESSDPRVAAAVVRKKILRGSAMSLQLNQSTMSRRTAALAAALVAGLFERVEGAMTATRAGAAAINAAERTQLP